RMPARNPTRSLATGDLKKEPWPQSWKMMNTRTSSAPRNAASGTTSHHDTGRHKYIRYQSSPIGMSVSMICHSARHGEGLWYLSTISFHAATSGPERRSVELISLFI